MSRKPQRPTLTREQLMDLLGQQWTPVEPDGSTYRGIDPAHYAGWVEPTPLYAELGIPHTDWDSEAFRKGGYVR